jgi:hypothetical protein
MGRMEAQGQPRQTVHKTSNSKITRAENMDWRCGSSSRTTAMQVQSPEFPPKRKVLPETARIVCTADKTGEELSISKTVSQEWKWQETGRWGLQLLNLAGSTPQIITKTTVVVSQKP